MALYIKDIVIPTLTSLDKWISSSSANYFDPAYEDIDLIKDWTHHLLDGELVNVRGRDILGTASEDSTIFNILYSDWEYGICLKYKRRLFLLWHSKVESVLIDGIDFKFQLHFRCEPSCSYFDNQQEHTKNNITVVLSHGFSDINGPNYPLIQVLENFLRHHGFKTIVPDFRPSYAFDRARGRSERVKIILENLIGIMHSSEEFANSNIVLIGHSQGGAASAQTCQSEMVVRGARIKGLVLLGSESPIEKLVSRYERHLAAMQQMGLDVSEYTNTNPDDDVIIHQNSPPLMEKRNILLIHSARDRVVHPLQIKQLGDSWGVPCVELFSDATPDDSSVEWADDVQHDFMSFDLLRNVIDIVINYLHRLQMEH